MMILAFILIVVLPPIIGAALVLSSVDKAHKYFKEHPYDDWF